MKRIKRVAKNLLKPIFRRFASRQSGLEKEVKFWDRWFRDKGLAWPDDFKFRSDPDAVISGWHKELVDLVAADSVAILDVGAGPMTVLGKKHPAKALDISAVDPLADEYDKQLSKYGMQPVVRTRKCEGEKLSRMFAKDSFDVLITQNCIDHAHDPAACIMNIVDVCRVGGYIGLAHAENEAEKEAYGGLHQWNFSLHGSNLIVSGKRYTRNIDKELIGRVRWEHRPDGEMIRSVGRKLA